MPNLVRSVALLIAAALLFAQSPAPAGTVKSSFSVGIRIVPVTRNAPSASFKPGNDLKIKKSVVSLARPARVTP